MFGAFYQDSMQILNVANSSHVSVCGKEKNDIIGLQGFTEETRTAELGKVNVRADQSFYLYHFK